MVVLEDVGLRLEILVNGSPAKEYIGNDDNGNENAAVSDAATKAPMCHRFVEIVAGADFSIQLESPLPITTLR